MRLLMLSTDRKILSPNSSVARRMIEYGTIFDELHIIIFSRASQAFHEQKIGPNVFLYPTRSASRWFYIFDAIRMGKAILSMVFFGQTAITTQDPFETGVVGAMLKLRSGYPLQVQLHTDAWSSYFQYANLFNWFRVTILAPFVLKRADAVRVVSEKIRRDVIIHAKLPAKKVSVLPVFVDVLSYTHAPVVKDLHKQYPEWQTIILIASRLSTEKNILLALKAFRRLSKQYPKVGLVIVGQGPELSKLTRFVLRNGLGKNIAFEDWQTDLASYYKTADIFLNTSRYEGYGMTLIEAGAAGCPVVTTQVGLSYDFLEDGRNALICPVGDSDCIYTKLVTLLENAHLRKSLGRELQQNVLTTVLSKEQYLKQYRSHFDLLF